jgi:hypothetical protein
MVVGEESHSLTASCRQQAWLHGVAHSHDQGIDVGIS